MPYQNVLKTCITYYKLHVIPIFENGFQDDAWNEKESNVSGENGAEKKREKILSSFLEFLNKSILYHKNITLNRSKMHCKRKRMLKN